MNKLLIFLSLVSAFSCVPLTGEKEKATKLDEEPEIRPEGAPEAVAPSTFSVLPVSAIEGQQFLFEITRSGHLNAEVAVDFETIIQGDDSASTGDFILTQGTVTFLQGEKSKMVIVQSYDDSIVENDESFTFILSNPTEQGVISSLFGSASGTIVDNDSIAPPSLPANIAPVHSLPSAQVIEVDRDLIFSPSNSNLISVRDDDAGSNNVSTTISVTEGNLNLVNTSTGAQIVDNNSARVVLIGNLNQINSALVGLIFKHSGVERATFSIETNDLGNSGTGGAKVTTNSFFIDVVAPPVAHFSITSTAGEEGENLVFNIARSGNLSRNHSVAYRAIIVSGDTASSSDFVMVNGVLNFTNQGSLSVTVPTVEDANHEGNETFTLELFNSSLYSNIITARAKGTINNDDPMTVPEPIPTPTSGISSINLDDLDGLSSGVTAGLKFNGHDSRGILGDRVGSSVAGIGDVNDDGKVDLLIGAMGLFSEQSSATYQVGGAYVVFGDDTANLRNLTDQNTGLVLKNINRENGVSFIAPTFSSRTGQNSSGGGDYNGDGVSDLLISDTNFQTTENAYIIYGDADFNDGGRFEDLNNLDLSRLVEGDLNGDGFDDGSILAGSSNHFEDMSVSHAGDIDNDGIDDFLIGQPGLAINGINSGVVYLVFGSINGHDQVGQLSSNTSNVIKFQGNTPSQFVGRSISGVGDINSDGISDFIIGATNASYGKGRAYVIFGNSRDKLTDLSHSINDESALYPNGLDSLNGTNGGFVISMESSPFSNSLLGLSVNALSDFNGDSVDDFIIGAPGIGIAAVIYGKRLGFNNIDIMRDLTSPGSDTNFLSKGFLIGFQGGTGRSVGSAGDLNKDGFVDLIVGADKDSSAYILFGGSDISTMLSVPSLLIDYSFPHFKMVDTGERGQHFLSGKLLYGKGLRFVGDSLSNAGASVAGLGDFNGDGFDDIAIGAPGAKPSTSINKEDPGSAGQVFVIYGQEFFQ